MLKATKDVAVRRANMRLTSADASTLHGIFAVNKPPGISCAGLLDYFKRNITKGSSSMSFSEHFDREQALRMKVDNQKKKARRRFVPSNIRVGHGGTLDVEAAGVLVFGINNGCKQLGEYLVGGKSYLATGLLGVATESYDAEGNVTLLADTATVNGSKIQEAIPQFIGEIMQRPPIYSAIKLDGKRLYEYARGGENIPTEIKPRSVTVSDVKLLYYENQAAGEKIGRQVMLPTDYADYYATGRYEWQNLAGTPVVGQPLLPFANQPTAPKFQLLINSGGGVYVRSLIHDLGQAVGSAATMVSLVRTSQGPLRLDRDTIEPQDLVYMDRVVEAIHHADAVIQSVQ